MTMNNTAINNANVNTAAKIDAAATRIKNMVEFILTIIDVTVQVAKEFDTRHPAVRQYSAVVLSFIIMALAFIWTTLREHFTSQDSLVDIVNDDIQWVKSTANTTRELWVAGVKRAYSQATGWATTKFTSAR